MQGGNLKKAPASQTAQRDGPLQVGAQGANHSLQPERYLQDMRDPQKYQFSKDKYTLQKVKYGNGNSLQAQSSPSAKVYQPQNPAGPFQPHGANSVHHPSASQGYTSKSGNNYGPSLAQNINQISHINSNMVAGGQHHPKNINQQRGSSISNNHSNQ